MGNPEKRVQAKIYLRSNIKIEKEAENLDRIVKDSLAEKVSKQIIHYINTGRYVSGHKLPSNEEMAAMFGVGRSSIRESLKELQTLGIVTLRHGDGTYLCDFPQARHGSVLLEQVIEVRRMIEVYSARAAATNPNEELISTLSGLSDQMMGSEDIESFIFYDRQFHYALSRSSNNLLIAKFHTSIDLLFDEVQKSIVVLSGSKDSAIQDHRLIVQAVSDRKPEMAAEISNLHIDHIMMQIEEIARQNQVLSNG